MSTFRLLASLSVLSLFPAACGDKSADDAHKAEGTCGGQADREIAACPEAKADRKQTIEECEENLKVYEGTGCGDAYRNWLACTAEAETWDCNDGPSGCDSAQDDYFACQSQYVQRTGCASLGVDDERCTAKEPDAFGCISNTPPRDGCIPMPDTGGSLANLYCCPK
jgi:hypothetical protein